MEVAVLCVLAFVCIAIGGPVVMYWRYQRTRIAMNVAVIAVCLLPLAAMVASRWRGAHEGLAWPATWALLSVVSFGLAFAFARVRLSRLRRMRRGLPGTVERREEEPRWRLDGELVPIVGEALDGPCLQGSALALDAEILEPEEQDYRTPAAPTRRLRAREIVTGTPLALREEAWLSFVDPFLTAAALGQLFAPVVAANLLLLIDWLS